MMVKHIAAALLPLLLTGINALPSALNADYLGTASSTVLAFLTSDDSLHLRSKLSNIHVKWMEPVSHGDLTLSYGDCEVLGTRSPSAHHHIGTTRLEDHDFLPDRFVWNVPEDAMGGGCLHAYLKRPDAVQIELVGRSGPISILSKKVKRAGNELNWNEGPWFDSAKYWTDKNESVPFVAQQKNKTIAIIGAGAAGLMSGLLLKSVGLTNFELIEASQRFGGRIHTAYLEGGPNDDSYQYQEMGPMRFPYTSTYSFTNATLPVKDHRIVFQLADTLNNLNKNDSAYKIQFIKWIQSMPNNLIYNKGVKTSDGRVPTKADISANPSLSVSVAAYDNATAAYNAITANATRLADLAENIFRAHQHALDQGLDDWSEFGYLHNKLGYSLGATDYNVGTGSEGFFNAIYDVFTFITTDWRTVDNGLSRIPQAFWPLLGDYASMGRKITKLSWTEDSKVALSWRENATDVAYQSKTYDYALVAVPFSVVRRWDYPGLPVTMTHAINNLAYASACKVALQFKTRWWEHMERPIFGGCSSSDLPNQSVCYPSYKINSTGPGVLLAQYASGQWGDRLASMNEADHVAMVLDGIAKMHGEFIRDKYTGKYDRRCWILDEFEGASWAQPSIGQHKLFMPEYFKTHNGIIFIGEHTHITHAWISSALESSVRGVVQLLVELGLITEAKEIVNTWEARFIRLKSHWLHKRGWKGF